jgi:UDP-N-acetylglucosamine:LPS N-acetylglucosamine transferase
MKICLAFSAGGHFTQIQRVIDAFNGHNVSFATIKAKPTENLPNVYYLRDTTGLTKIHMLLNMIIVAIQSLKIIIKERPNIIVSTGADVTIPICYLGKFLNVKIFFIESFSRVNDLSPSGKIVYPIADLFLVQWKRLTKKYSKAKYWGSVL